jgi:NTP pyrophosphatase (non-canonical NTP hydrolase)
MAVVSEAGELAAEYRWLRSDEVDEWSAKPENRERVAAEAADVGIALLLFCERVGIDFLEAIERKIEVNRRNYPVEASKGERERPGADAK